MNTSIIIVNYQTKKEVFDCIESIYKSKSKISFEIIVVDNSEKNIIEKDLKRKFPKVIYIKSEKNLGYGAGNNLGARHANGKYLFILNPDTKFHSGDLSELVSFTEKNKKVGAVAPLLLDEKNNAYPNQGGKTLTPSRALFALSFIDKFFPNNPISKSYRYSGWDKTRINEVDIVPGTAFIIKKEVFEKIGGFDESFFLFFEEFDLCKRLHKAGYKNYINPILKINHKWGASTSKNIKSKKYYIQSRFYYFKKHYGVLKAIFIETFLRININSILLFSIISLALFLRLYRLSDILPFIGDSAWFYMSARDLIIENKIPLVGITTSHTWLHQGAFWTYILAVILKIFNFNPFIPAYFTSVLDIGTVIIIYFLAKEMFNKKIALISSLIYSVSPLVVSVAQSAYHTSIIPFFTAFFLLSVYKWVTNRPLFFPIALFLFAILYNLEIATISLGITLLVLIFFGLIKKKSWTLRLLKPKILFLSFAGLLIPMIPMLLYDINHGFNQTLKVVAWIFYKIAVEFGYPPLNPDIASETWETFFPFLFTHAQKFYLIHFELVSLFLFVVSISFAIYKIFFSSLKRTNLALVSLFLLLPLFSYFAAKTNSGAYLPMFFPQAAILLGFFFGSFRKSLMPISILLFFFIVLINSHYLLTTNYFGRPSLRERIYAAKIITGLAKGKEYNLVGVGEGSEHDSFILNQEYLTWWLGNAPSKKDEKLKFFVFPDGTIRVEKK